MSRAVVAVMLLALAPVAAAQSRDDSRIDGNAAADVSGAASINVAAGVGNAQANLRAIAIGDASLARAFGTQAVDTSGADLTRAATVTISPIRAGATKDRTTSTATKDANRSRVVVTASAGRI